LDAEQFELRVDGKASILKNFHGPLPHADRSIPLVAWIIIDFNPQIDAHVIQAQGKAASEAFGLYHPDSALGVKLVSDRSETLAPLGRDPGALLRAFSEFSDRRTVLSVKPNTGTTMVGEGGILRAMEFAMDELETYISAQGSLKGREVHRALMVLSNGNINPRYNRQFLYDRALREGIFFYPVFIPPTPYAFWIDYFLDLAKKTGGVASELGSLKLFRYSSRIPPGDTQQNALTFNFIHMAQDLNGKYSFDLDPPAGGKAAKLNLQCRRKGIKILMPRKTIP